LTRGSDGFIVALGLFTMVEESAGGSARGFFVNVREAGHRCKYSIHSGGFRCSLIRTMTIYLGFLYQHRHWGILFPSPLSA